MADPTPSRPDAVAPSAAPRSIPRSALLWMAGAIAVGTVGLLVVVNVQREPGAAPPTSMFAAAGIVMSLVSFVTVLGASTVAGASRRAALALAGGFAAIAIAKFAVGPTALYHGNRHEEIQSVGGLSDRATVVAIAIGVLLLYAAAIWLLATLFRPSPPPDGPGGWSVFVVATLSIGLVVGMGILATSAPAQYVTWATTGLEAGGLALALFVAAVLVAVSFRDTAVRARRLGAISVYLTVVWVALAFLAVFQVLWVVFLLAVVAIWPFRSVTPK